MNVGIIIFNQVEELDFVGPFQVFSTVNKVRSHLGSSVDLPELRVFTAAQSKDTIICGNGLRVLPDYDFSDCPDTDILVVPGGGGRDRGRVREMKNPAMLEFVSRQARQARFVTSVCTGAFILANAGLLDGKRATTHWKYRQELSNYSSVKVMDGRVIEDGNVITGAGVASGVDLALHVVERCFGEIVRLAVSRAIELEPVATEFAH